MSAQIHQLHTEAPAAQSTTPNKHERGVITEYVQILKQRGFCKIDDASSNHTRLYNRLNGKVLPVSYIENNFIEWLEETGKDCNFTSGAYIMRKLPHIVGPIFKPVDYEFIVEDDTGCRYANTYRRYQPTTDSADVPEEFLEFFKRLFPIEEERHIVLQWLAHLFKHPEQRPSWHLMFTSEPGTGKGFLFEKILHPLILHTTLVANYAKITGKFSTVLEENLLVLLDDCKARSEAQQTELKSLLTEERTYVERKQLQGGMVNTYTRFILASNERKPLDLEETERRWYPVTWMEHEVDADTTQREIAKLADWLDEPESLCKVYNWFTQYPLKGFNYKRVPPSTVLRDMVAMSKSLHAQYLDSFVAEHKVFTTEQVQNYFIDKKLGALPTQRLSDVMKDAGYKNSQKEIDADTRLRLWYPVAMTIEQIREAFSTDF